MKIGQIIGAVVGRPAAVGALGAAMVFGAFGCASQKSEVTVTSSHSNQTYREPFTWAFASHRDGDLQIVMADDAAVAALSGTQSSSPVRQILDVQVLWRPDHTLSVNAPSLTNATLHWYVIGDPHTRPGEVLEYTGTAFVTVDSDRDDPTIRIQNASMKCAYQHGLCDPVGSSRIEGSVTAQTDEGRVEQLLSEVRDAITSAPPTTAPAGPTATVAP